MREQQTKETMIKKQCLTSEEVRLNLLVNLHLTCIEKSLDAIDVLTDRWPNDTFTDEVQEQIEQFRERWNL